MDPDWVLADGRGCGEDGMMVNGAGFGNGLDEDAVGPTASAAWRSIYDGDGWGVNPNGDVADDSVDPTYS